VIETPTEFGELLLATKIPAWQLVAITAICIWPIRETIAFMFRIDAEGMKNE